METKIKILNSTLHDLFTLYTYEGLYSIENIYSYFFENDINYEITNYSYDHKKYTKELANIITEFIEYEIINYSEIIQKYITKVTFNGIVNNPQFYNDSTDTFELELCINKKELRKRFNYLLKNEKSLLEDIIKENFTSYSGFISFFPEKLEEYIELSELKDIDNVEKILALVFRADIILDFDKNELKESLYQFILDQLVGNTDVFEFVKLEFNKYSYPYFREFFEKEEEEQKRIIKESGITKEDIKTILENDRLDMLNKLSFNDYKFEYNYTNYSAKNEIEAYLIWYYLKKEEDNIYA